MQRCEKIKNMILQNTKMVHVALTNAKNTKGDVEFWIIIFRQYSSVLKVANNLSKVCIKSKTFVIFRHWHQAVAGNEDKSSSSTKRSDSLGEAWMSEGASLTSPVGSKAKPQPCVVCELSMCSQMHSRTENAWKSHDKITALFHFCTEQQWC